MDDLIRNLIEWCPSNGVDAWPIMREAAAELRTLRAEYAQLERLHDKLQDVAQGLLRERDAALAGVSEKCRHTSDRNRAATALKGLTDADHVRGTLGDSDGDDGA